MRATGTLGQGVLEFSPEFGVFKKTGEIPKFGFEVLEAIVLRVHGLTPVGHRMARLAIGTIDFERDDGLDPSDFKKNLNEQTQIHIFQNL